MRHVVPTLVACLCATLVACQTTPRHAGKKVAKRAGVAKLSDDYTLTGRAAGVNDTSYYLERDGDDDAGGGLPFGAFAPGSADLADEVDEQMFPDTPGTVEEALGETGPLVQLFMVASEGAPVRNEPAEAGELLRELTSGERLAATVEGTWARIGKNQFVPLSALEPVSGYDERQRASLDVDATTAP